MKPLRLAVLFVCCAAAGRVWAAERLIYSITRNGPGNVETEVFSISPGDPQPTRVFSDASMAVMLGFAPRPSGGIASLQTAISGDKMYSPGKERASRSPARATAIYEFALDGSGKYRKVLDIPNGERVDELIVQRSGRKLAYLSLSGAGLTLFIHEVSSGNLIQKINMAKIAGDCIVRRTGWLPDDKTLFFNLEPGDADSTTDADYNLAGSWLIHEDGLSPTHLPQSFGMLRKPGYRANPDLPPTLLGMAGNQYMFHLWMYQEATRLHEAASFFVLSDAHSGATKEISSGAAGKYWYLPSLSGNYIAYTQQGAAKYEGKVYVYPPEHLWVMPVPTGDPKEVLSLATGPVTRPSLSILGWTGE